jgi:hypothetical protein
MLKKTSSRSRAKKIRSVDRMRPAGRTLHMPALEISSDSWDKAQNLLNTKLVIDIWNL